jgi:hypothetical protein
LAAVEELGLEVGIKCALPGSFHSKVRSLPAPLAPAFFAAWGRAVAFGGPFGTMTRRRRFLAVCMDRVFKTARLDVLRPCAGTALARWRSHTEREVRTELARVEKKYLAENYG